MSPPEIHLILVEDHAVLSAELEQWINATDGLHCGGVYGSGEALLEIFPSPLRMSLWWTCGCPA